MNHIKDTTQHQEVMEWAHIAVLYECVCVCVNICDTVVKWECKHLHIPLFIRRYVLSDSILFTFLLSTQSTSSACSHPYAQPMQIDAEKNYCFGIKSSCAYLWNFIMFDYQRNWNENMIAMCEFGEEECTYASSMCCCPLSFAKLRNLFSSWMKSEVVAVAFICKLHWYFKKYKQFNC